MISFALEDDQLLLQETVRKFAIGLRENGRAFERARGVPSTLGDSFRALGLQLVDVPEADGGLGLGTLSACLIHEELAFGDPGAALALWSPSSATSAIVELGDEEQRRRLLARFGEGAVGAVAWSEVATADRPLPAMGCATTARRDGDGWILDGTKAFVIHGGQAALTIVFAQEVGPGVAATGWDGIGAFVIEGTAPGLSVAKRHDLLGLDAVPVTTLGLSSVRVPAHDRLAAPAGARSSLARFFARLQLANGARQVGLARAAYEYALGYTQDREAFGKPVAHFQSVAFTLADMLMDVDSARWLLWRAARTFDLGRDAREAVAKATVHTNEAAWRVADQGVQLLGGAGYIQDHPVEMWLRDTRALALVGVPDEIARLIAAEQAIGRDDFDAPLPSSLLQPVLT